MKIIILIPAYNEKGNLEILTKTIERQLKKLKINFKILFVLQGTDGSRELISFLKQKKPYLDFIYYKYPLGIGQAYKIGYQHLDKSCTHVLTMDADLNHDIGDLSRFLHAMTEQKCDVVIGSRFIRGGKFADKRLWKKIASIATNKIVTKIIGIRIKDISSGYRLIKKEVINKIHKKLKNKGYPSYMEFIMLTYKSGFKICEVPITYHARLWGQSKINSFTTFIDYLKFVGSIVFNS